MKILFVTPSYKPAYIYGGPAISVSELAEALVAIGHEVVVYTTTANGKQELDVSPGQPTNVNGVTVYYFKRQTGDHTHVSVGLWKKLYSSVSNFDIVNLQSWWSLLIIGAAQICRLKKAPYVLSPRGMLSSYTFEHQKGIIKRLLHRVIGRSLLKASYLHATTRLEWDDCKKIIPGWNGFVLPNLVRFPQDEVSTKRVRREEDPIIFGFLSRIDQKKGIELLMKGLSSVNYNYQLKIAGTGESAYAESLRELSRQLKIDNRIEWCGWKSGDEKFVFLETIDVFTLTSYNENFANSVIESLSVGTPVFITEKVGLADYVEQKKLGWICQTTIESIGERLKTIHEDRANFCSFRELTPRLIRRDFNKNFLAQQYIDQYKQLS